MNIKRRGGRAYLYRSRWVRRSAQTPHGYPTQDYVGSMPLDAKRIPEALLSKLDEEEIQLLEQRICGPVREAEQRAKTEAEQRELAPLWRIEEAIRLLSEAAMRSEVQRVPGSRIEAVQAELARIRIIEASVSRESAATRPDALSEALRAIRLAMRAVQEGAYGHAPAEGVRRTKAYARWSEILEAVSGENGSLLRALQDRGFVKTRRG